jgi:hypothetical protein
MALKDLMQADLLAMEELLEDVEYQQNTAEEEGEWLPRRAVVRRSDSASPFELGETSRRGPEPVRVLLPKDSTTGIAAVNRRLDKVKLQPGTAAERIYSVSEVLEPDDPGVWTIYAVP